MQNLTILATAVPEISLGASKFKVGHVTLTTPPLRVICLRYAGTWHSLHASKNQNLTTLASAVPEVWLAPTKI